MIKLLDLCCKAGGCSEGYRRAAADMGKEIEITGIDNQLQPNYPFNFIQADAVDFLKNNYQNYTHIHASPPCQKYSNSTIKMRKLGKVYPDNLNAIRDFMYSIPLPGIIENVPGSPLRKDIILRGDMFGLKVLKKRHFEVINFFMMRPGIPKKIGSVKAGDFAQVLGNGQLKVTGGGSLKLKEIQ